MVYSIANKGIYFIAGIRHVEFLFASTLVIHNHVQLVLQHVPLHIGHISTDHIAVTLHFNNPLPSPHTGFGSRRPSLNEIHVYAIGAATTRSEIKTIAFGPIGTSSTAGCIA